MIKKIIVPIVVIIVIGVSAIIYLASSYIPFEVRGKSMAPNLEERELILTSKINDKTELKRSDIIVYQDPNKDADYIKRIIAIPGDEIMIKDGKVYLNNALLEEPYTYQDTKTLNLENAFTKEGEKIIVTANNYFVLGDYREFSVDSRTQGFIPRENIEGLYESCYWNCK